MRITPKKLGSELTLDEYNACQYLLYNMTCWNDKIMLNTYTPFIGKYAEYLLNDKHSLLIPDKNDTLKLTNNITTTKNALTLQLQNINKIVTGLHLGFNITLYIKKPTTQNVGTNNDNDTNTENITYDPTDQPEIKEWGTDETHPQPDITKDYTKLQITCTYNPKTQEINIPLVNTKQEPIIPVNTIIHRQVQLQIKFNNKPYIDTRNGKANDINEQFAYTTAQLEKIVTYAPADNKTFTIIRLDSNIEKYQLSKNIIVKYGQNIIIRGGTNINAVIDGTTAKRSFRINAGGYLKLQNITLQNNNSNQTGVYDQGKGGAILVEHSPLINNTNFGVCDLVNCKFINNKARYGGAVYSYHAGLYIDNCTFDSNTASISGGAVMYQSRDVQMWFANIIAKKGEVIKPSVGVKYIDGTKVTDGQVYFYILYEYDSKTKQYVELKDITEPDYKVDINNGSAETIHKIPNDFTLKQFNIVAIYKGNSITDDEVSKNTVYIKD